MARTRSTSTAGAFCTISSSLLRRRPERVRLTWSDVLGALVAELSADDEPPARLVASVRRVPAASVGRKPWPLILSVITCLRRPLAPRWVIGLSAENFRAYPLGAYSYFP